MTPPNDKNIEELKAIWAYENALSQSVYNAYIEVAKGAIDRCNASAEFVQKAAASIATVYTGVLAFTFAADTTKGKPLPLSGLAAPLFFGLAIFLATVFRAYITQAPGTAEESAPLAVEQKFANRNTFIKWVSSGPLARQSWLHAAVISLGVGAILLPMPFINIPDIVLGPIVGICLVATLVVPAIEDDLKKVSIRGKWFKPMECPLKAWCPAAKEAAPRTRKADPT